MFTLNEKNHKYEAEIGGIQFVCEKIQDNYEGLALDIAMGYETKRLQIIDFIMESVTSAYGAMTRDELIRKLGKPCIHLDMEVLTYDNHSLKEEDSKYHILEIEFSGKLEQLYYFSIVPVEKKRGEPAVDYEKMVAAYQLATEKASIIGSNYQPGDYKSMTIREKIEFMRKYVPKKSLCLMKMEMIMEWEQIII